jgi:hypothetical protein
MSKSKTLLWNSFSNLIVMHIREGGSILTLALINLCIILIVAVNKRLISLLTPTHKTTQVKQTMKSMPKTMETTLAIILNSPQKTMVMAT